MDEERDDRDESDTMDSGDDTVEHVASDGRRRSRWSSSSDGIDGGARVTNCDMKALLA
jgi:hypothetical protein